MAKRLTQGDIQAASSDLPPILTVDEAASLARVPRKTILVWSSKGHLSCCARKRGKHLLIFRDKFLEMLFNGPDW
ncbi:MAG: helix-turn-helix domain-containing protein [Planctomycetota bacterium]|nr:helix-turn-helix domain-containing protein [Planctomycetota bacterium]